MRATRSHRRAGSGFASRRKLAARCATSSLGWRDWACARGSRPCSRKIARWSSSIWHPQPLRSQVPIYRRRPSNRCATSEDSGARLSSFRDASCKHASPASRVETLEGWSSSRLMRSRRSRRDTLDDLEEAGASARRKSLRLNAITGREEATGDHIHFGHDGRAKGVLLTREFYLEHPFDSSGCHHAREWLFPCCIARHFRAHRILCLCYPGVASTTPPPSTWSPSTCARCERDYDGSARRLRRATAHRQERHVGGRLEDKLLRGRSNRPAFAELKDRVRLCRRSSNSSGIATAGLSKWREGRSRLRYFV